MPFPEPTHGLVIRYSYLWRDEHLKGQEEGVKDRPCAIILVVTNEENADQTVTVIPGAAGDRAGCRYRLLPHLARSLTTVLPLVVRQKRPACCKRVPQSLIPFPGKP